MYRARMATTYDTGKMAMCNTGEDGHVYVITLVTQARMAMRNTGDDGHVYVTTSYILSDRMHTEGAKRPFKGVPLLDELLIT